MSKQNNDNNEKNRKRFLSRFLDKDGFYLILLVCISLVMVTALWISKYEEEYFISEDSIEESQDSDEAEIHLVEGEKGDGLQETTKSSESLKDRQKLELRESPRKPIEEEIINGVDQDNRLREKEEEKEEGKEEDKTIQETKKTDEKKSKEEDVEEDKKSNEKEEVGTVNKKFDYMMSQPVIGKMGLAYAEDKLVYHETLAQWRTHRGVDIHATEGAPVRAAMEGEVIEIVNDTLMGITIRLAHKDDLVTVYSNLSTDSMVKLGDYVKKGQVISGIGRTAANKKEEGPLLHFQVLSSGQPIDPQILLPKIDR